MYHSPSNLEPRCIHIHDWYLTRDTSGLLLVVELSLMDPFTLTEDLFGVAEPTNEDFSAKTSSSTNSQNTAQIAVAMVPGGAAGVYDIDSVILS
jgi:hypothetical protein